MFVSQRVSEELKKTVDNIQQESKPWLIINGVKEDGETVALLQSKAEKILSLDGTTNIPAITVVHRFGKEKYGE